MTRPVSLQNLRLAGARREGGVTLIIGLILLALLTLIVINSFKLASSNLRATGNLQFRDEALAAAGNAIERRSPRPRIGRRPAGADFPGGHRPGWHRRLHGCTRRAGLFARPEGIRRGAKRHRTGAVDRRGIDLGYGVGFRCGSHQRRDRRCGPRPPGRRVTLSAEDKAVRARDRHGAKLRSS